MASTNKTPQLGLNSWLATDSPLRADFNADNAIIDEKLGYAYDAADANRTLGSLALYYAAKAAPALAAGGAGGRWGINYDDLKKGHNVDMKQSTVYEAEDDYGRFFTAAPQLDCGYPNYGYSQYNCTSHIFVFNVAVTSRLSKLEYWLQSPAARSETFTLTVWTIGADGKLTGTKQTMTATHSLTTTKTQYSASPTWTLEPGRYGLTFAASSNPNDNYLNTDNSRNEDPVAIAPYSCTVSSLAAGTLISTAGSIRPRIRITFAHTPAVPPTLITGNMAIKSGSKRASVYVAHKNLRNQINAVRLVTGTETVTLTRDATFDYAAADGSGDERWTGAAPSGTFRLEVELKSGAPATGQIRSYTVHAYA